MPDWQPLGPHCYRVEEDVLFWCPNGEVLPEHAQGVCRFFDALVERHGYVLWLVDARRSLAIGHESRLAYVRWFDRQKQPRMAVASFGAPLPAKTTASLILRGVQIVKGVDVAMQMFAHEAEARAYLEAQRSSLRAVAAS